ncbi:MAG: hypothetical protein AAGA35_01300 [Patescibacteria group bacterium]
MNVPFYHVLLRVAAVVTAFILVFDSGLLSTTTSQLSQSTQNYLGAAVGVSVGVAPTELNQMTAAITERERELDEREAAVADREIAINLSTQTGTTQDIDISTYVLSTILFILLVLIVLNYILDYVRGREQLRYEQRSQAT